MKELCTLKIYNTCAWELAGWLIGFNILKPRTHTGWKDSLIMGQIFNTFMACEELYETLQVAANFPTEETEENLPNNFVHVK